jgi:hypothetical protein
MSIIGIFITQLRLGFTQDIPEMCRIMGTYLRYFGQAHLQTRAQQVRAGHGSLNP